MDHFYIITNIPKDPQLQVTRSITSYLLAHGKTCVTDTDGYQTQQDANVSEYRYTDPKKIPDEIDCIIVLGGDGTMIQTARDTVDRQIPIFGINIGTLGYLIEIDRNGIFPALDSLMSGDYQLERRMMLQGSVYRGEQLIDSDIALNDIVIGREGAIRVIALHNYVNGKYLNQYRADGVIISTPTGSTGYSLSAGGPLISPAASIFLMTPIAAHTLNSRSVVLPSENEITVLIGEGKDGATEHAVACFDGDTRVPMVTGDRVVISKADKDAIIVKIHDDSFWEILRRKMSVQ